MTDKTDALVAQLDDYLQGCPDPNKVWPKWMVRKASRLLWACREALAAPAASVDVDTLKGIAFNLNDIAAGLFNVHRIRAQQISGLAAQLSALIDSAGGAKGGES